MDRFQGQQNDYILLSLVRTKAVGHLRYVEKNSCIVAEVYVFHIRKMFDTLHKVSTISVHSGTEV